MSEPTKPKKPTLTATTPYGELRRATWRKYTHVVVLTTPKLTAALAWCGSERLALGQLRFWTAEGGKHLRWRHAVGDSWEVQIFPIDGTGARSVGPIVHSPIVADDDNELNLPF